MKRLVIALSLLALLGIIYPGMSIFAQPTRTPHENPDTAEEALDKEGLLLSYGNIVNLATNHQYRDATDTLNQMAHTVIPINLQNTVDRYNELFHRLFTTMDNLESLLDEASFQLSQNELHEAKAELDRATIDSQNAIYLLEDIKVASDTLRDQLGISASPAGSQITKAYSRLEENMARLSNLVNELNDLRDSLDEKYTEMLVLLPTEISLNINRTLAFIGGKITVSGSLSCQGRPLGGRNLILNIDNRSGKTITTQVDGTYTGIITIPYEYTDNMTLTAVYIPSDNDEGIYLACQSPPQRISTMFYPTLIAFSAPTTIYPGNPVTISGEVITHDSNTSRTVRVLFDETELSRATVSRQFSFEVIPPEHAPPGKHRLTVAVTPQLQYSGIYRTLNVNMTPLSVNVDARTPATILLPHAVPVSGTVYHQLGPVGNAEVNLSVKNSTAAVRTSTDGSFEASLKPPIDLSPFGSQEITIDIRPTEPWLEASRIQRQIFIINPLGTGIILAILAVLGIILYRRRTSRLSVDAGNLRPAITELPAITPFPEQKSKLTGIRRQVLSAYRNVLEAIEKITGADMTPDTTMREFLRMAALPSSTITEQFTELTLIAESALYSACGPHKDIAAKAEELALTIKEELYREAS